MPRNVRNFWIEAEMDGRKKPIKFGPRAKDGGFRLTIYMRNEGEVDTVLELNGHAEDEKLVLWVGSGEVGDKGGVRCIKSQEEHFGVIKICRQR